MVLQTFRTAATLGFAAALIGFCNEGRASVIVDKTPNYNSNVGEVCCLASYVGGDSVFADSFVFNGGDSVATTLGAWMDNWDQAVPADGEPGTNVRFELWSDNNNSPGSPLSVTPWFTDSSASASLQTEDLITPVTLTAGDRYWLVESVVGQPDLGSYEFPWHARNSEGYNDNGSFWVGSYSDGSYTWINYSGRYNTPEITVYVADNAASVNTAAPEPATWALLVTGLVAFGSLKTWGRKRAVIHQE